MDERDRERPRPREVEVPGLSPVRAFFAVCVLATAVGGLFFATRDASPSEPPAPASSPRSPDFSLTDAEAIAEFERLHALAIASYRKQDVSLVKTFALPDSRYARTVEREIRTLIRDGVLDRTRSRTISEEVVSNTPLLIKVEQIVLEQPKFIDARTDREITINGITQEQTVVWTLELSDGKWFLSGATITAAHGRENEDS